MSLVWVKDKYQVTLPVDVRRRAGLAVGDLLEATVEELIADLHKRRNRHVRKVKIGKRHA